MDDLDKKIGQMVKQCMKRNTGTHETKCPGDLILASYLDGVLSEADRERVEHHLLECQDCLHLVQVQC